MFVVTVVMVVLAWATHLSGAVRHSSRGRRAFVLSVAATSALYTLGVFFVAGGHRTNGRLRHVWMPARGRDLAMAVMAMAMCAMCASALKNIEKKYITLPLVAGRHRTNRRR